MRSAQSYAKLQPTAAGYYNVNTNGGSRRCGAFAHRSPDVRADAIAEGKRSVDMARESAVLPLVCGLALMGSIARFKWLSYPVDLLVDGVRRVADYAKPDIRIGIEYVARAKDQMTIGAVRRLLLFRKWDSIT